MIVQEKVESFVRALLSWAKDNTRDFPWRKTNDPYRILIAEIMLQRTKADQVVPSFENFVLNYPNPQVLDKTSLEDVRKSIRSLGLEKRAQGLKRLAKQLVTHHGGKIPNNKKELLGLYGIGNYIANAVLCLAYGEDVPLVDANFARVLKRVFSLQTKEPAQKDKRVWLFATRIMPYARSHSRELNLAIIDLASLICTPKNPKCAECPLNKNCDYALRTGKSSGLCANHL